MNLAVGMTCPVCMSQLDYPMPADPDDEAAMNQMIGAARAAGWSPVAMKMKGERGWQPVLVCAVCARKRALRRYRSLVVASGFGIVCALVNALFCVQNIIDRNWWPARVQAVLVLINVVNVQITASFTLSLRRRMP